MPIDSETVFVLGAGFTKAFLPDAPLLVDDFRGPILKQRFGQFPDAEFLLDLELKSDPDAKDRINLERLMTRLVAGMPYDRRRGNQVQLSLLLGELKRVLVERLVEARSKDSPDRGELSLFARTCCFERCHCITFNYDDLIDQALWDAIPVHSGSGKEWNPDHGYPSSA